MHFWTGFRYIPLYIFYKLIIERIFIYHNMSCDVYLYNEYLESFSAETGTIQVHNLNFKKFMNTFHAFKSSPERIGKTSTSII